MGITVEHQEEGSFSVPLLPELPRSVQTAIDIRTYAFAQVIVTPEWIRPGDVTDTELRGMARYCGLYYQQSDNLLNLEGPGLRRLLGTDNDAGDMYGGVDTTSANLNFADQLDARIFTSHANGLTRGSTNALATLRTIKIPGNVTRLTLMETIMAIYDTTPFEDRINPDGTVDFDTQATLYPTTTTPTVILTAEGGRDGTVTGLHADLDLGTIDVDDVRSRIEARWNETTPGTNNGIANNTLPSTYVDYAGGAIDHVSVIDFNPRKQFRERPNKSDRYNGARYGAYYVNTLTQANNLATRHANQTAAYSLEVTADVDEYDPWRFVKVGDSVWCYDLDLNLVDTANEVYYRGSAIHPQKLRVQAMTTPIVEGYGVYLRRSDGAGGFLTPYDLTPFVDFEEGDTTFELGTHKRFHRANARPRRFNRRRIRRQQRRLYVLGKYLQKVSR